MLHSLLVYIEVCAVIKLSLLTLPCSGQSLYAVVLNVRLRRTQNVVEMVCPDTVIDVVKLSNVDQEEDQPWEMISR